MLESFKHAESVFVTLTYDPVHYPPDGSLRPLHMRAFLDLLRKLMKPAKFRYYAVGEYGDQTWRAHYHVILFGIRVVDAERIARAWNKGFCSVFPLTIELAQYCAGYVVKKMTMKDHPQLSGRAPEFARMSLRPGIGAKAMEDVALALGDAQGAESISRNGDVPDHLLRGRKKLVLGRYLRRKLREEMGFAEIGGQPNSPAALIRRQELREMREASKTGPRSFRELVIESEKIRQVEGRLNIWSKKGIL